MSFVSQREEVHDFPWYNLIGLLFNKYAIELYKTVETIGTHTKDSYLICKILHSFTTNIDVKLRSYLSLYNYLL